MAGKRCNKDRERAKLHLIAAYILEERILAWRQHPEHVEAQRPGSSRWYESYRVEVTKITRDYRQSF